MRRGDSRQSRAEARQAKVLQGLEWNWKIWRKCEICQQDFCVNCAWEDRKPRTPSIQGVVVCPKCDPRKAHEIYGWPYMGKKIRHKGKYRVVMALVILKKLSKARCLGKGEEGCKCFTCAAKKLMEVTS